MNFWKKVFDQTTNTEAISGLQRKIRDMLPGKEEVTLTKVACIAGLMARVAHADLKIEQREIVSMKAALSNWTSLEEEDIHAITTLAIEDIRELSGLENQLYTGPLRELMDEGERYQLLETLFEIAASDGDCENIESEEIRLITKGLVLNHQHFISARATVANKLTALRG